jgi:DNA-binding NtrC family response regulator
MNWLNQRSPEILLCGSDDVFLREFRVLISRQGYEVQSAVNPVNAIRRARTSGFKAVVLLLDNGNADWLESIPVLNDLFPGLPIIVVADQDCLETERKAREGRIFYYLLKPVDQVEVKAVLRDATAHPSQAAREDESYGTNQ